MRLSVLKLRDGWAVLEGREALVRGLRERRDAHKIKYDVERKGWFRGAVTFVRGGVIHEITVPADADVPGAVGSGPEARWAADLKRRTHKDSHSSNEDIADEGSVDDL